MNSKNLIRLIRALVVEDRPDSSKFEDAIELLNHSATLLRNAEQRIRCTHRMDALMFDRLVYGTILVNKIEQQLQKNPELWNQVPNETKKLFEKANDKVSRLTFPEDDEGSSEAV